MIKVTPSISIGKHELEEHFIRSPGSGGQKVNKTESAVQLRFNARGSSALTNAVFLRLRTLAGRRMTKDGNVIITANQFRTQELNRRDALDRLISLLREAVKAPTHRRPKKQSKTAKLRRLDSKRHQSNLKKVRGKVKAE